MTSKLAKGLSSSELHDFFENVAAMLSIGVQTDEAVHMLAEVSEKGTLKHAAEAAYHEIIKGKKLSAALESTHLFPKQTIQLIQAGERTGHLEDTLNSLSVYYGEEERLFQKARVAIAYPCLLLCVLSAILAFTVGAILPVFLDVYNSMTGGLTTSSYAFVSVGIAIGWVALGITIVLALCALAAMFLCRTNEGRRYLFAIINLFPFARKSVYSLSLSRFTSTLAIYSASGSNIDDAVSQALQTIDNQQLYKRVAQAHAAMIEPVRAAGLVEAFTLYQVYDPQYLRMLTFSLHAGRIDTVLIDLSQRFFEEAIDGFDALVEKIEPALAGFVTVAVGASLISVMLPLIAMMTSLN